MFYGIENSEAVYLQFALGSSPSPLVCACVYRAMYDLSMFCPGVLRILRLPPFQYTWPPVSKPIQNIIQQVLLTV